MTFSIVAYDPDTEEIGIAVQSKAFSVGSIVPFAKAGVGGVATQSLVNVSLGPIGLEKMEEGKNPAEILNEMRELDEGIELRQLGFYSVEHGPFSFTGNECIQFAGGITGEYYACQGNLLKGPEVIEELSRGFEEAEGTLAERLLEGLRAAQNAGGDARGRQSAAIIVEHEGKGRANYGSRKIDLRVEDDIYPLDELDRLLEIRLVNLSIGEIMELANEDINQAISRLESLVDDRRLRWLDEAWMTLGTLYHRNEDIENAKRCVSTSLKINPKLKVMLKEYPKLGIGFDEDFVQEFGG